MLGTLADGGGCYIRVYEYTSNKMHVRHFALDRLIVLYLKTTIGL